MIQFKKIRSYDEVSDFLYQKIALHLENREKVLWLVSGGSVIPIEARVLKIYRQGVDHKNLVIALADERFGEPVHSESIYFQLQQSGFVPKVAEFLPVLRNKPIEETSQNFEMWLKLKLKQSKFKIGLFGMGSDGHTAGILPNSPIIKSSNLVDSYDGGQYKRISVTTRLISQLDYAVLYAIGVEKQNALIALKRSGSILSQPAQALKQAKNLIVFNDHIGD